MECIYVDKAEYIGGFTVRLCFNDGKEGVADQEDIILCASARST